jgi:hypothetical protein
MIVVKDARPVPQGEPRLSTALAVVRRSGGKKSATKLNAAGGANASKTPRSMRLSDIIANVWENDVPIDVRDHMIAAIVKIRRLLNISASVPVNRFKVANISVKVGPAKRPYFSSVKFGMLARSE